MIRMNGPTKYYGDQPALVDVTLRVPAGVVLGYLGPNGVQRSAEETRDSRRAGGGQVGRVTQDREPARATRPGRLAIGATCFHEPTRGGDW
jgi:ABC-type enterochelin transport system ATPase subunit